MITKTKYQRVLLTGLQTRQCLTFLELLPTTSTKISKTVAPEQDGDTMLLLSERRCNTSLPAQRNKNLKTKTVAACEDMSWIYFSLDRVQCQTWDKSEQQWATDWTARI
jgi:hypothetical protein